MQVIDKARLSMRRDGNLTQWSNGYPDRRLMADETRRGDCHVLTTPGGDIVGTFCLVEGPDPTYARIEGAWLNDAPYHVIHRLAADGSVKGIAARCIAWCKQHCATDLRIDTHADNRAMRHILQREGFTRCGIIRVGDGTPRIAYQLINK